VNRVVSLDDRGLVEEPAGRVVVGGVAGADGTRYDQGTHTLSIGGGLCVVDGRRYGVNRHRIVREVRARARVRL
jgi:hypothetical protein